MKKRIIGVTVSLLALGLVGARPSLSSLQAQIDELFALLASIELTPGPQGPAGPPGPEGPPGPSVSTVAVCVDASLEGDPVSGTCHDGECSCESGLLISRVTTGPGPSGQCTVTSDTGGCSAQGAFDGTATNCSGECCVCGQIDDGGGGGGLPM